MTRNEQIVERINHGERASALGRELGISRERVRQVYTECTGRRIPARHPVKPCAHCCRAFKPHHKGERYCSVACASESHRIWFPFLTKCAQCGETIEVNARQQISRAQNISQGYIKHIRPDQYHCSPSCAVRHGRRLERQAVAA